MLEMDYNSITITKQMESEIQIEPAAMRLNADLHPYKRHGIEGRSAQLDILDSKNFNSMLNKPINTTATQSHTGKSHTGKSHTGKEGDLSALSD